MDTTMELLHTKAGWMSRVFGIESADLLACDAQRVSGAWQRSTPYQFLYAGRLGSYFLATGDHQFEPLPEARARRLFAELPVRLRAVGPWPEDPEPARPAENRAQVQAMNASPEVLQPGDPQPSFPRLSLAFFGSYAAEYRPDKYDLLFHCAAEADRMGLEAIWIPERHFHEFGGFSPNPSVLAAALAMRTQRIELRAGSVVLPLHHPVRAAEEWATVDNLSGGRVAIAAASGWHANDFVFNPTAFGQQRDVMFQYLEDLRRLWRGEVVRYPGGGGDVDVRLFPQPARPELPIWITSVGNPETWRDAGQLGANVLTNLMSQGLTALQQKIAIYRSARAAAGFAPETGTVTLLIHTFVGDSTAEAVRIAREPFTAYLGCQLGLLTDLARSLGLPDVRSLPPDDRAFLLDHAYQRYLQGAALIGDPARCAEILANIATLGVDEFACFIDFGVAAEEVRASLRHFAELRSLAAQPAALAAVSASS